MGRVECGANGYVWVPISRDNRWSYYGLVNEPCFDKPTAPDENGLWLDKRVPESAECPKDPFADEQKYPGIKIGARGVNIPVGSYYGEPSGVVGLRLFPNPAFDAAAEAKWDAEKFYTDSSYFENKDLVRPYRVGMSCGFCHVGPSAINPPADPENPKWENLTSNPGAQYFWVDRIFFFQKNQDSSFVFQLFHTQLPGTLDTSLVSSDNINNPRTMNAIYGLSARLQHAHDIGKETLKGGGLDNKQFNQYPATAVLSNMFVAPDTVYTPRVLKDGSDSVGALGALNRVYLNIGLASEEWLRHFTPLIGPTQLKGPVSPIKIADLEKVSSYWKANEEQTPAVAAFFLASTSPDYLKDAPGGANYLKVDAKEAGSGQDRLRASAARGATRARPPNLPPARPSAPCNGRQYHLEQMQDYSSSDEYFECDDARKCTSPIFSTTISCRPTGACRSRCSRPTRAARWRPTRSRTTSGTTSRRRATRICRRSGRSPFTARSTDRRSSSRCPLAGAATRGRRR